MYTILFHVNAHFCASTHCTIFTVLWFCRGLCKIPIQSHFQLCTLAHTYAAAITWICNLGVKTSGWFTSTSPLIPLPDTAFTTDNLAAFSEPPLRF